MKAKTKWLALLMAVWMLMLCGCGKRAVNKDEGQTVVQETAESVQETTEPAGEIANLGEENAAPAVEQIEKEAEAAETPATEQEEAEGAEDPKEAEEDAQQEKPEAVTEESPEMPEESETEQAAETAAETTPAEEGPESVSEVEETEPEAAEPEIQRSIEITVPAEYADVRYRIGEITWNPDDSATYRLTEEEHIRLLEEVRSDIQQELNEMCASPYFLDFFSIEANEDCSVFTVVCLSIETTMAEQESIPQLYEYGKKFAAYEGREPGNIHIDYMTKLGNTFVTRDSERDERQTAAG